MRALLLVGLALPLMACGADMGAGAGAQIQSPVAPVAFGRVAASTRISLPLNEAGVLFGAAVESRYQHELGSRYTAGVLAGYGSGPSIFDGRVGWEAYGEFGTTLETTLFRDGDLYAGVGGALPIRLSPGRQIADLNDSTWLLKRRFELLPMLRVRQYVDHGSHGQALGRTDVSGGLAFRLRVFTDLF